MLSDPRFVRPPVYNLGMSNRENDLANPSSMIDVDLLADWNNDKISVTVYNNDYTEVDNLRHRGYNIIRMEVII